MPYTFPASSTLPSPSPNINLLRFDVPTGNAGVGRTLMLMRSMALGGEGAQNAQIRQLASKILIDYQVPARDESAEAHALSDWIRSNIRFTGEHNDAVQESLQSPKVTLQMRTGDCDDFSILLSALLSAVGIRNRFQVVKARGQENNPAAPWAHVYVVATNKRTGEVLMLDPTLDTGDGYQFSTSQVNSGGGEFGLGMLHPNTAPEGLGCDCERGRTMRAAGLGDLSSILSGVLNSPALTALAQGEATNLAYGNRSSLTTVQSSTAANPFATPAQLSTGAITTTNSLTPTIPIWLWVAGVGLAGVLLFKR